MRAYLAEFLSDRRVVNLPRFVWLPILNVKLPVSNRFGNVQPSVMAHRILWNIEQVYVK